MLTLPMQHYHLVAVRMPSHLRHSAHRLIVYWPDCAHRPLQHGLLVQKLEMTGRRQHDLPSRSLARIEVAPAQSRPCKILSVVKLPIVIMEKTHLRNCIIEYTEQQLAFNIDQLGGSGHKCGELVTYSWSPWARSHQRGRCR